MRGGKHKGFSTFVFPPPHTITTISLPPRPHFSHANHHPPTPSPKKQTPHELLPKLFGELRERYAERPGGYTRVLRTEPKDKYNQAPSAILELVDGPKDMRFAMTAAAVARDRSLGKPHTDLTQKNIAKVTRYRREGREAFEAMVGRVEGLKLQ